MLLWRHKGSTRLLCAGPIYHMYMPASHLTIWAPLLISGDIEASLGSSAEDGQPEEDIYEVTCFSPVAVQGLSGHFR